MKNQEADQNSKDVLLLEMDIRMRKPLSYVQIKMVSRAGGLCRMLSKLKALSSIVLQLKGEY
jgi:hypothetical protein